MAHVRYGGGSQWVVVYVLLFHNAIITRARAPKSSFHFRSIVGYNSMGWGPSHGELGNEWNRGAGGAMWGDR